MSNIKFLEYIWLDVDNNYRSKTKTYAHDYKNKFDLTCVPEWNYDGSSTGQADSNDSEVVIKPVYMARNTFRMDKSRQDSWFVLCDTWLPNGDPHPTNTRFAAKKIFDNELVKKEETYFGFEQEFFALCHSQNIENKTSIECYCQVGYKKVFHRQFIEESLSHLVDAGLNITGFNNEVAPEQFEFQVLGEGIEAADQLHVLRYILIRCSEKYELKVELHPKLFADMNGSGCHANYSTKTMREEGGIDAIYKAIDKLKEKHDDHIKVYGKHNELRLTGKHETSSITEFTFGVADRGASVRIPHSTESDGKGYFEDRRPASNIDPYVVSSKIAETTLL
tara:strand:- start:92 stop:1099 length:1008 start_codon:yes stop_codon:yes gene_type:complete